MRICFLGAGSTVFAKNVLGDCILTPELGEFEIALYDIDKTRLEESFMVISAINKKYNGKATILKYLGVEKRKEALKGSSFIINAIQVGGYKPCTVTDFKIPRRYGLQQTIGDTLGVGGIMRALRTFPVLKDFANDIEEVCPDAYFLNYTNPMAMLTGYLLKYTKVKAVGLCHSVQAVVPTLLQKVKLDKAIKAEETSWTVYGINHQAWLLEITDKDGNDLYPEIKRRALAKEFSFWGWLDAVRMRFMTFFGYYVTESSEHNAEYTPWFIKKFNPIRWAKYKIPLNEYPRRCRYQIWSWKKTSKRLTTDESLVKHEKSHEYGSKIIEALYTGKPFTFHGSVLNTEGYITNLPKEACVEIPIIADANGLTPQFCGALPEQCAAVNLTNINPQLLALKANETRQLQDISRAVALDPHAGSVLTLDQIEKMCAALYKEHHKGGWLPEYK